MYRSVTTACFFVLLTAALSGNSIARDDPWGTNPNIVAEDLADNVTETGVAESTAALSVYDSALASLVERAQQGDAVAALAAGQVLVKTERAAEEQTKGIELLIIAESEGLEAAWPVLGEAYRRGVGGAGPDYERAIAYYDLATKAGDFAARRTLASLLLDLRYSTTDIERATALLEAAAAEGDISAAVSLAGLYARNLNRSGGGREAAQLYDLAVVAGDIGAMRALAELYRSGANGLTGDVAKAQALLEAAAERGETAAARRVAEMMMRGEIPGGTRAAVERLQAIAAAGEPRALVDLGDLFSKGEFAAIDASASERYFSKAAEAGLVDGYLRLGDIYRSGLREIRPDASKAMAFYLDALPLAAGAANNRLGDLYRFGGPGIEPDAAKAEGYYRAAISAGEYAAKRSLAAMYLDGKLVTPSVPSALPLLEELGSGPINRE